MCLQSICCNGFGKKYDDFRREILQTYGKEYKCIFVGDASMSPYEILVRRIEI